MTIHYHGTPITPWSALNQLRGRHFCVSHARPDHVKWCHEWGQSVMLDNGAFSAWKVGYLPDWAGFYDWCEVWLHFPTTWAVIPDVIDGSEAEQNRLVSEWPFSHRGAPVWHMNESIDRLKRLCDNWFKVCIGSTAQYARVLSEDWQRRMDEVFELLARCYRYLPWVHMLRGMSCSGKRWPFASVDSTDVGRNHNRPQNTPVSLADRWDVVQCDPWSWT